MALQVRGNTFLSSKEAAERLGMAYSTFTNRRTSRGDGFLRGYPGIIPGRVLFRVEEVEAAAAERGR